jgi:hypothetical protein
MPKDKIRVQGSVLEEYFFYRLLTLDYAYVASHSCTESILFSILSSASFRMIAYRNYLKFLNLSFCSEACKAKQNDMAKINFRMS